MLQILTSDPTASGAALLTWLRTRWRIENLFKYAAEHHGINSLADPDEYRAITRHLLHQGGQITYTPTAVTITLDRPDSPRVARALKTLTDELNTQPAHLPGDRRPLTYHVHQS